MPLTERFLIELYDSRATDMSWWQEHLPTIVETLQVMSAANKTVMMITPDGITTYTLAEFLDKTKGDALPDTRDVEEEVQRLIAEAAQRRLHPSEN